MVLSWAIRKIPVWNARNTLFFYLGYLATKGVALSAGYISGFILVTASQTFIDTDKNLLSTLPGMSDLDIFLSTLFQSIHQFSYLLLLLIACLLLLTCHHRTIRRFVFSILPVLLALALFSQYELSPDSHRFVWIAVNIVKLFAAAGAVQYLFPLIHNLRNETH